MNNIDINGRRRGKCKNKKNDGCPQYIFNRRGHSNRCDYCDCVPTDHEDLSDLNMELAVIDPNLNIEEAFKFLTIMETTYKIKFCPWRTEEEKLIKELRSIADNLEEMTKDTNKKKLIGSSISASLGALTILAAICAGAATGGAALIPLLICSGGVSGAYATKQISKQSSETNLKFKEIQEVQKKQDKNNEGLKDFFMEIIKYKFIIDHLMDFEIFSAAYSPSDNMLPHDNIQEAHRMFKEINSDIKWKLDKLYDICPELPSILKDISFERKNINRQLLASEINIAFKAIRLSDAGFDIINNAVRIFGTTSKTAVKCFGHSIAGVGLAIDLGIMAWTIKDMVQGSKLVNDIRKTILALEKEIEVLYSAYCAIGSALDYKRKRTEMLKDKEKKKS